MKHLRLLIVVFLLFALLAVTVSAGSDRLSDGAGLLNEEEAADLAVLLDRYSADADADFAVVTVYGLNGKTAESFADDWYDAHAFGDDGVLLLIDMDSRSWHISTAGNCIDLFGDPSRNGLAERYFLGGLHRGDYSGSFRRFAEMCRDVCAGSYVPYDTRDDPPYHDPSYDPQWGNKRITVSPERWALRGGVCLGIGLIIALIVIISWKRKLKTVRFQNAANTYIKEGSLTLTNSRDFFLYNTVSRTPRPQQNSSRGGGGGGGGAHFSSGGVHHGGGGGHF